jgi:phosphoribosylformylglycinamidine synthase
VRDILAMGARPVAVMDPLRFGPLTADDTRRVLPGIVAGVGGYGNCLGLPNIGGEVVFDRTYVGNPLVNALCVGVLRHEDLHLAHASGEQSAGMTYSIKRASKIQFPLAMIGMLTRRLRSRYPSISKSGSGASN